MANNYFVKNSIAVDGFLFTGSDEFCDQILPDYTLFSYLDDSILTYLSIIPQTTKVVFTGNDITNLITQRVFETRPITDADIMHYKNNNLIKYAVDFVYLQQSNIEVAQKYYGEAVQHGYDGCKTFDSYWIYYVSAHEFYKDLYKRIGINPRVFERDINGEFREVGKLYV